MSEPAKYVVLKCDDADTSLSAVKKDGIIKCMNAKITKMIDEKSGGKLTTKNKSPDGYSVLAKVTSLKADDPKNPKKLKATLSLQVAPTGSSTKGANVTTNGEASGVSLKTLQADAEGLISDIIEPLMTKWFSAV